MITSKQVAKMRWLLGTSIDMKVEDKEIRGIWNDIQLDTKTGTITGVYVGERLYKLSQIDHFYSAYK